MRRKHTPHRTCVGCRTVKPKRELIRVVRLAQGGVTIDGTGKQSGRGAYLCRSRKCWENALGRGRLEHALKVRLTGEEKESLRAFAERLSETEESESMQAQRGDAAEQGG